MQKVILISFLIALLSLGCSVRKRSINKSIDISEYSAGGNSLKEILENNISNNNFYIQKADVRLTQDNVTVRFNATIKFKRPDSLLISVKSKTGMEAGRALMTRDTLIINDRINKKIITGEAKSIRKKYGIEPYYFFALLGDLIVNEEDKENRIDCKRAVNLARLQVNEERIEYTIDCSKGKVVSALFEGDLKSGNIKINYSDFMRISKILIPEKIEISDDKSNINILIEVKKIEIPWEGPLKLVTGSGYKIVRIR